jgi:hypothetical protein
MTTLRATTARSGTAAARPTTAAPVPRWVNRIAHLVPLTTLPSGLWRLALGFGAPMGFTGRVADEYGGPGWITPYVIVLSLLSEGLALLTLGLVQPWGEVVPRWIPFLGGRRIPALAAVVPAALGAAALIWLSVVVVHGWGGSANDPDEPFYPQGGWAVLMTACYAPLLAWGPLLAVVTVAYYLRRTRGPKAAAQPSTLA